jgi:hypothetical protein
MRRALVMGAWLLLAAMPAAAARLDLPVRTANRPVAAPAYAGERMVVRLRPDVAYAAWAARDPIRAQGRLAAVRVPALEAISARLGGAPLEPEFRGLRPEQWSSELASFWIARLPAGADLASSLDALAGNASVVGTSPIAILPLEDTVALGAAAEAGAVAAGGNRLAVTIPNDSMFAACYWLRQTSRKDLHALEAWDVTRGDSSVVIAVLDTGVLLWHPDLGGTTAGSSGQIWTNRRELEGLPGVDDDGNGYIDDFHGWDYVSLDSASIARPGEDWRDEDNDPVDFAVHGTAVSGVAAGIVDNGIGIAGVAPGARIMAMRCGYAGTLNPAGEIDETWAAQAMVYAAQNGATVLNCSFSTVPQPDLVAAANFVLASHVTIVVAAGNNGTSHYLSDRDETITVAATDQADKVTLFSNRGTFVDVCAPGQTIATTTIKSTGTDSIGSRTPSYSAGEAGTSFSSPMVAGAVALLQSQRHAQGLPLLHPYLVQLRIKETTDDISNLNTGTDYGTGRVNLQRMLTDPPRSIAFPAIAPTVGSAVVLRTASGGARVANVSSDGYLRVFDASSGAALATVALGGTPVGGIAAADLGGGQNGLFVALRDGRIVGLNPSGQTLPGWPVDATTTRGVSDAMPALGDLDGDGRLEVVWGGDDGSVWAWHADGTRVSGFPRDIGSSGTNVRVALGDLIPARPGLEIVAATHDFAIHALDGSGAPLPGWPVVIGDTPTAPIIDRIGVTSRPAVVLANGLAVRVYDADGKRRMIAQLPTLVTQEAAVGDLNGDGLDEIVVMTTGPDAISAYDSAGVVLNYRTQPTLLAGPPLIGPLAPGTGAQVVFAVHDDATRLRLTAFSFAGGFTAVRGWPKSGHPSNELSMADIDNDGTTELVAGVGGDSLSYIYDSGPGSWRPAAAAWPTPRGNYARTGSRLDAPPLALIDDVGPPAVVDLAADPPGTHRVTLRWDAPADPGHTTPVAEYDLRVANTALDESGFLAARRIATLAPGPPGNPESLAVDSLPENTDQWFALRARDAAGNWSPFSAPLDVRLLSEAPGGVFGMQLIAGSDSTVTLQWVASGDDGGIGRPAYYRVRWSQGPLDSASFEIAPGRADVPARAAAGSTERAVLRGFVRGLRYWIYMRAVDAAGNQSAIAGPVGPEIGGRIAASSGIALFPSHSPSPAPLELQWQAATGFAGEPAFIQIFDVSGRMLRRLGLPRSTGGLVTWDGSNESGGTVRSGVYFARLTSGPHHVQTRLVLIR